jgi:hypothetical protein
LFSAGAKVEAEDLSPTIHHAILENIEDQESVAQNKEEP